MILTVFKAQNVVLLEKKLTRALKIEMPKIVIIPVTVKMTTSSGRFVE